MHMKYTGKDHEIRVRNLRLVNSQWNKETNQMTESRLKTTHKLPEVSLLESSS